MLSWCSYCQRFQGEVPPYTDLRITHGLCATCRPSAMTFRDADLAHTRTLQRLYLALMKAGRTSDMSAAERIISEAESTGCRAVDVLIAIVAPMLCQIGEEWERGVLTVAEEHRFTAFCARLCELVGRWGAVSTSTESGEAQRTKILAMNADGNRHTLGARILALWLSSHGQPAELVAPSCGLEEKVDLVRQFQPRLLMISIALPEQRPNVVTLVDRIVALPFADRVNILIGGYAVKQDLVAPIAGAELIKDISVLRDRWL